MAVATPPFQQLSSQAWQSYHASLATTQLQQPYGNALEMALAAAKDYAADRIRLALKAKLPGLAPPDALSQIGIERGMPQGQSETSAAYAARLINAWNMWPWAGTPYGMLQVFFRTGYTNVVLAQPRGGKLFSLDVNGNLVTSLASPPTWTPTYTTDPFWSRFDVVFPAPLPASWGGGSTVPASNSAESNFIRSIINSWKPGHATCNRIVIVTSGKIWGYPTTQVWGAGTGNWGSSTTTVWTP